MGTDFRRVAISKETIGGRRGEKDQNFIVSMGRDGRKSEKKTRIDKGKEKEIT